MKKTLRTSLQLMTALLLPAMAFGQTSDYTTAGEWRGIMLYPNPTEGKFQISYDREAGEELKVTIYDVRGTQIQIPQTSLNNSADGTEVDLSRYGKGIYMVYLHLPNGEKVASEKVMVY